MAAGTARRRLRSGGVISPASTDGNATATTGFLQNSRDDGTQPNRRRQSARTARVPYVLLAADVLAATAATAVAAGTFRWGAVFTLSLVGVYLALGLYRTRLTLSVLDDLPRLAGGAGLATVATASLVVLTPSLLDAANVHLAIAAVAGVLMGRLAGYALVRQVRRRGLATHQTLVLGAGLVGREVADKIETHPEFGLRLVGFVDAEHPGDDTLRGPVFGDHRELVQIVRDHDVSVVIVAFGGVLANDLVDVLRSCRGCECDIFVVPRLFEVQAPGRPDYLRSIPLLRLGRAPESSRQWKVKRAADVLLSGLALGVLAPVMLLTALAVRLEMGPGVLFRQQRIGRHGHRFTLLKFRSYRKADGGNPDTRWAANGSQSIGPVGRFIRRTSLDELPQLLNVLRGDMSLVGPRPERPYFVDIFESELPAYRFRHRVPAGLTGWAAVNGLRGDTSIKERVHFDNHYIDNWSLWLDAKILMRTVTQVLRGAGG